MLTHHDRHAQALRRGYPIVNLSHVNTNKELTRYRFTRCGRTMWFVYRKGVLVGVYSEFGFEPLAGYENLDKFVRAVYAQIARQQILTTRRIA